MYSMQPLARLEDDPKSGAIFVQFTHCESLIKYILRQKTRNRTLHIIRFIRRNRYNDRTNTKNGI